MYSSKQVDRSSYEFKRYLTKERWCSFWHQIDEIQKLRPREVLEVGPGPGLFKIVAATLGIHVETLDIDPELKPDHLGSATAMPIHDATFDTVCAFQMLEHLPYDVSLQAFEEMVRVSRSHVIISLPDALPVWRYHIHLPIIGVFDFYVSRPFAKPKIHEFDGEHYWEINKYNYALARVISDFSKMATLVKSYRVPENPMHRFFVFNK